MRLVVTQRRTGLQRPFWAAVVFSVMAAAAPVHAGAADPAMDAIAARSRSLIGPLVILDGEIAAALQARSV
jgi:hypothetical protein